MAPNRPPHLTHFLALPLVTETSRPQLRASLQRLSADLQASGLLSGLEDGERTIRPLGTLHLTLGVMSLPTAEKLARAVKVLQEMDVAALMMMAAGVPSIGHEAVPAHGKVERPAPAPTRLTISLRSLATMQSPSATSVLYAVPVDRAHDEGRLLAFCNHARQAFEKKGLIVVEHRPLLLHAAVVNTVYGTKAHPTAADGPSGSRAPTGDAVRDAKEGRGGGKGWQVVDKKKHGYQKGKLKLNAVDFIKQYDGVEFATDIELRTMVICKMGAKKVTSGDAERRELGEEYQVVALREI
ncbi:MAG: hypothetical protein M1826_007522 [Phylliscum demangeonii]|nr:MAG: hypothetical protein M1826_007522 [Phylliscum demangeonii]